MTIAAELKRNARNANDAMDRAAFITDDIDQDWEHGATLYTFDDASVLVACGESVDAYASMSDARAAADKA